MLYWYQLRPVEIIYFDDIQLHRWGDKNFSLPSWRLYWNTLPGMVIQFKGQKFRPDSSRLFLIPPNTPFSGYLERPIGHFFISFFAGFPFNQITPAIFSFSVNRQLRDWIREARHLFHRPPMPNSNVRLSLLLHLMVIHALRQIPPSSMSSLQHDHRIRQVLQIMAGRLDSPVCNKELATAIHMGTSTFIRFFRKVIGHSPYAYHMMMRINRAANLLVNTNYSIKEIAEQTGFGDRYHFSRVFKKTRRTSPATFRDMRAGSSKLGRPS